MRISLACLTLSQHHQWQWPLWIMSTSYTACRSPSFSDRDRVFTSQFWKEMARLTGTKLRMSSAYHPQTDGQTERVNQCLEAFLCCFTHACPAKWAQWLSLAEYWYNTSLHSALDGKSPFQVLYGHSLRHFGLSTSDACTVPDLEVWLQERGLMLRLLQQHLE